MKPPLPIDDFIPSIIDSLRTHPHLVVTAAPGAGKTTRLPPALVQAEAGKILVLEPRRMAAIAAASRVAEENGWTTGNEVGWQVRFDNQTTPKTRLIFLTEALLARKMLQDPELSGVSAVVIDEFHERSLHTDVGLGLLKELCDMGRDLKIIVMSATLEAERLSGYLGGAPIIAVPGQLHPLAIEHQKAPQLLTTGPDFINRVQEAVRDVCRDGTRDTLVFLPGTGEIQRLETSLRRSAWADTLDIQPLHGSLSLSEQRQALRQGPRRRIILSTNIAESSVTVDGVDTVVDSGLARRSRFDLRTGFERLELSRISLNSAIQRSGRAARQFPGRCLRLWSPQDEASMTKDETPEIARADLTEALLLLAKQGVRNFENFSWYEAPPGPLLRSAQKTLQLMGALEHSGALSGLGNEILRFPTHPRIALLLMKSFSFGVLDDGARFASLLQERDFLDEQSAKNHLGEKWECDLLLRASLMERLGPATLRSSFEQYRRLARTVEITVSQNDSTDPRREILLKAFADRLCRRRPGTDRGRMIGGRGVRLSPGSVVRESEFFLALRGREVDGESETRIDWACGLEKEFVLKVMADRIDRRETPMVDSEKGRIYLETARYIDDLPLEEGTRRIADPDTAAAHLPALCLARLQNLRADNTRFDSWLRRWNHFRREYPDDHLIDPLDPEFSLAAFERATFGETDLNVVAGKDLCFFFESGFSQDLVQKFRRELPESIEVPSGRRHPVQYPDSGDAYLEVRLQEVFGWTENPRILGGRRPLILHLLAPNRRPVQVTADLASFWRNGYSEVRKELRARYPKHFWPDDPASAPATDRTKKGRIPSKN